MKYVCPACKWTGEAETSFPCPACGIGDATFPLIELKENLIVTGDDTHAQPFLRRLALPTKPGSSPIAQDKMGNVALGYSLASSTVYDSIAATGRAPGDPLGQMEAEVLLVAGAGSQIIYYRWGDYSSMAIDGSDGCTFWYAQEYFTVPASTDWQTRLTSFKFSGCQ